MPCLTQFRRARQTVTQAAPGAHRGDDSVPFLLPVNHLEVPHRQVPIARTTRPYADCHVIAGCKRRVDGGEVVRERGGAELTVQNDRAVSGARKRQVGQDWARPVEVVAGRGGGGVGSADRKAARRGGPLRAQRLCGGLFAATLSLVCGPLRVLDRVREARPEDQRCAAIASVPGPVGVRVEGEAVARRLRAASWTASGRPASTCQPSIS